MLIVSLLITGVVICHADESTTASDDSDDGARILVSKFFLSQYAVEEKDYVVDYRLYNTGDKVCITNCYPKLLIENTVNICIL